MRLPKARNAEQARVVGRLWAEFEVADPRSLKGTPGKNAWFWFVAEALDLVAPDAPGDRRELAWIVGSSAEDRWGELAEGGEEPATSWGFGDDDQD
jgi:hypothetical protein